MCFQNSDGVHNESVKLMLNAIHSFQGAFLIDEVDIASLYNFCPSKMLWEAFSQKKARVITWEKIPLFLADYNCPICVFREPLQDLYYSKPISHTEMDIRTLKECFRRAGSVMMDGEEMPISNSEYDSPLYFIDKRLNWMLVLTGENNQVGSQLCVLISKM